MSKVKMVKSVEEYNAAIAGSGLGMLWREKQCQELMNVIWNIYFQFVLTFSPHGVPLAEWLPLSLAAGHKNMKENAYFTRFKSFSINWKIDFRRILISTLGWCWRTRRSINGS